ncbi:MAG: sulfur oxidation c-type cytochrome SoxX [Burkholderiales bacterium]|nr:sulfur oxidation c-type cytochrome SoxX [Burkholderiales bacterium]
MATFRIPCALLLLALSAPATVAAEDLPGREIAHAQEKGNCLACHRMPTDPGAVTAATLGPVLKNVRERFPDRAALRAQIWDASAKNRDTIMPLYGRHRILTEAEIDLVTDYIHGL